MQSSVYLPALLALQDAEYGAFQSKLIPTVDPARIVGVRTPALRQLAKEQAGTPQAEAFLTALPHDYFEENQLHAFLLCREKDFDRCLARVNAFLPYIDNWATCDQLSPPVLKRRKPALAAAVAAWLADQAPYTVRFGIGMAMRYFLDEDFDPEWPARIAEIRSDDYYVNMMIAWYFATALAKQYNVILPYFTTRRLPVWVHNKAIQKARESRRITSERKEQLAALKG